MKYKKLLALLLTLAMVLPMAAPILPVSAEETAVEEIPTATLPAETGSTDGEIPSIQQWNFSSETELEDFDLYQSAGSKFVVNNGVLQADGEDGEQKAILKQEIANVKTVSVNILPNDAGTIYGGVLIGANDAANGQDQVDAMTVLVKSDYTGWADAPNRIDLVVGEFHNGWTQHDYIISETGNGNNLFSGGTKQPLNLKIAIGYDTLLVTLSLVSNPAKYIQRIYQVDHEKLQGKVGLRSLGSATKYDRFTINEDYLPETLTQGLEFDGTGTTSYVKTSAGMSAKPVTVEAWFKMDQLPGGSQRQALISNYTAGGLAGQKVGTWGIYTNESGTLWYTEKTSAGEFNQTLGINLWKNEWIHFVLVRKSGVLEIYINGNLAKSVTNAKIGESTSLANPLTFGYCGVGGSTGRSAMSGVIGDVRMWSTERTLQQIQDTMYEDLTNTEEGLIHHWDFDEQCGSGVMDHVGNLPGTVIGAKWTNPKAGTNVFSGVQLDGTLKDSYVKSLQTVSEKPVTIEAWVNMDAVTSKSRRQAIITNYIDGGLANQSNGTWGLYTDETGLLYYTEKSSTGSFNQNLGYNVWRDAWIHVALVRSPGVLHIYINGSFFKSITNAAIGDTLCLSHYLTIGYCGVGGSTGINSLQGEIGDIRLWSTERTAEEIKANMYADLTGTEEGLTHHWDFDSQKYGVVSNSVSGSTDCELLGHTQIGNEEIRRWDFSEESQLEDFTWYASNDKPSVQAVSITNGMLYSAGQHNKSSTDAKAVLNETIDNITYIGADVTQGTNHANTGLIVGIKKINSATANDYEGVLLGMVRQRTSSAKLPWTEIYFQKILDTAVKTVAGTATNTSFFPSAYEKPPYHIQVEFDGNTANSLMYRLDDPTITNSLSHTFADGELDGQIGLRWCFCTHGYDNFTVVSQNPDTAEIEPEQPPVEKEEVLYDNQGYSFLYDRESWKLTKDLAETPYTVEAWVKIPEGVADSAAGYILSNIARAPYVSLQMIAGGKLRLGVGAENEGLAIVSKNYDVDIDLRTSKWTHIAYTMDVSADQVVAYINGEAVATWENAQLPAISFPDHIHPDNRFSIGSWGEGYVGLNDIAASGKLVGWIADVRMWNKPLSADEVKDSMLTQYTQSREGLMVNLPLNEKQDNAFADLSGNDYTVKKYSDKITLEQQTHEPGSYSMIVVPDQQILSDYFPTKLNNLYQWIADNREKENIQIVMNVGDMANHCGRVSEWENTRAAVELLPDDLPFTAVPGNHDYDTNSGWTYTSSDRNQLTLMNKYLPRSLFESYPTEIGFFDEVNSTNHWQTFTVNGHPYMVLALEYIPHDDVIAWANEVVEAHPDHQVIMITHSFVGSFGELDMPYIWSDFLSKHENVIMTFSGHVWHGSVVRRTDEGVNGNPVHNILMDAQFTDATTGGYAMLGILRFNADGTLCNVSYYSTDKDMYDATSNFTLEIPAPITAVARVGDRYYETVAEAIAAANGETIQIVMDTNEAITVSSDVTIDLAGCKLGNVTVAEGVKLNLIDSTADYAGTNGSATVISGKVESLVEYDGKKYMVIGENGVYAPHRYYVGITNVSLAPNVTGFGYKAEFYGDEKVQAQVANIGFDLWLTEDRVISKTTGFKNTLTLRLKNFMVAQYGETPVNAQVYMTLNDGTKLESTIHSYSMRNMIELINDSAADFSVAQLQNVAMLIKKNPAMEDWNVSNILAILQPAVNVESITITDQAMTLPDGTTNTFTLNGAYSFTAQDTAQTIAYSDYADWTADYYITMDQTAGEGLYLAGNYGSYGWIALPVEAGQTYTAVPVVASLLGTSLTYEEMVTQVGSFSCGVADTQSANTGANVTVELRLTNPETNEHIVINTAQITL